MINSHVLSYFNVRNWRGPLLYNSFQPLFFLQKRLNAIDSSELKPLSSVLDIADSSTKLQNVHHPSTANQHQSLGHSIFLKRSRHHYAHQYSRRGLANLANASTSRGKGTSLRDDKLSFKFATQCNSVLGRHSGSAIIYIFTFFFCFPF